MSSEAEHHDSLTPEEFENLSSDRIGGRRGDEGGDEARRWERHLATHPKDAEAHQLNEDIAAAAGIASRGETPQPPGGDAYFAGLADRVRERAGAAAATPPRERPRAAPTPLLSRVAWSFAGAAVAAGLVLVLVPNTPSHPATPSGDDAGAIKPPDRPIDAMPIEHGRGLRIDRQDLDIETHLRAIEREIRIWQSRPDRGSLGIAMTKPPMRDDLMGVFDAKLTQPGIRVASVRPGSPAEAMGVQPGDRITALNGQEVSGTNDLHLMRFALRIAKMDHGSRIRLTVRRGDETLQLSGELGRFKP